MQSPHDSTATRSQWLIASYRAGENSQLLALAESLGWPFTLKKLVYRTRGNLTSLLRRTGLGGIDTQRSDELAPPWPDLVISAGFRNEPVCRWIKQASGNRTRLVHIGRPWADLSQFDLVVTAPQYRLPDHPKALHNELTLHNISEHNLRQAGEHWRSRVSHLPQPCIAVLVGGNTGPYTLGPNTARRLGKQASRLAANLAASLLVTTSSRTPPAFLDSFKSAVTVPAQYFAWSPNTTDNPYHGFLALAERIIVTADSIAMLSEACGTRKPVYIFDPAGGERDEDFRLAAKLYRLLMQFGPRRLSRDVDLVHQSLIRSGRAVWLGQDFPARKPGPVEDMDRALARIRALFDGENRSIHDSGDRSPRRAQ